MFDFTPLVDQPLLHTARFPELGGNINGPSLVRIPKWVIQPLGRYYLYFAHHDGKNIRLAYADELTGPWHLYQPGTLHLRESGFCQHAPTPEDMHPDVLAMIADGIDGDYPHIASPDIHVDKQTQKILMYFHGRLEDGRQATRLALSDDGIHFSVEDELLGLSYFRVFKYQEYHYAISVGGVLYRSTDGRSGFERGPKITKQHYRHGAILAIDNLVYVIWTRAGDCPERLLISVLDTTGNWLDWLLADTVELHRPVSDWEGANEPLMASRYGGIMSPVHQLRDPCVFREEEKTFVLYSVAGEQGLAIGQIEGQLS